MAEGGERLRTVLDDCRKVEKDLACIRIIIPWYCVVSQQPPPDGFTELLYPPVAKDRCCPELHLKNGPLIGFSSNG